MPLSITIRVRNKVHVAKIKSVMDSQTHSMHTISLALINDVIDSRLAPDEFLLNNCLDDLV